MSNAPAGRPPCRADHIGSLLRPRKLREAFRKHAAHEMSDGQFRAAQDEAIRDVVKLQEDCGLEVVTDGEFRRISYWEKFVRLTQGLESQGLVSSKTALLEQIDVLRRRTEEAAKHMDIARLAISPQCGFASTIGGNPVTEADERAKLGLCVEAARKIWG